LGDLSQGLSCHWFIFKPTLTHDLKTLLWRAILAISVISAVLLFLLSALHRIKTKLVTCLSENTYHYWKIIIWLQCEFKIVICAHKFDIVNTCTWHEGKCNNLGFVLLSKDPYLWVWVNTHGRLIYKTIHGRQVLVSS
jgi:hypothetical protein